LLEVLFTTSTSTLLEVLFTTSASTHSDGDSNLCYTFLLEVLVTTSASTSVLALVVKRTSSKMPQWCDDRGNPTKSIPINKLIELVKKCEARKDGAKSHVKCPLNSHEFLAMQSKLKDHPDWSLYTKYRTMNLYQCHLIGRADDTCHFEVTDPCGIRSFDFALQTKVVGR